MQTFRFVPAMAVLLSASVLFAEDLATLQAENKVLQSTVELQKLQLAQMTKENQAMKAQLEELRQQIQKLRNPSVTNASAGGWSTTTKPAEKRAAEKDKPLQYRGVPVNEKWVSSAYYLCKRILYLSPEGKYLTLKEHKPISDKPAEEGVLYYFPKPRSETTAKHPFTAMSANYYDMDYNKELYIRREAHSYNSGVRRSSGGGTEVVRVHEPMIRMHLKTADAARYVGKAMPTTIAMIYVGLFTTSTRHSFSSTAMPSYQEVKQVTRDQFEDFIRQGNELPVKIPLP